MRLAPLLLLALASCAPANPDAPRTPAPEPSPPSPPPPATARPEGLVFAVDRAGSRATIRVNEQVANVQLPGEAVLRTSAFDGEVLLRTDGTFADGSLVRVDLDTLLSDSDLRDEWIKINTLETRRYRYAELVPRSVSGVPLPLPAGGEWSARLVSTMRIKGVEREVLWDLATRRTPTGIVATGATRFRFGDYGMAVPANRLVLSVVDDVRLEVELALVLR